MTRAHHIRKLYSGEGKNISAIEKETNHDPKTIVKPSLNHRQTIAKPSPSHRQTIVKPSLNHRQTIDKDRFIINLWN